MQFNTTTDPKGGVNQFYSYMLTCVKLKEEDDKSFNRSAKRFYIECEHPDNPYTISDGESIYCSIDKDSFNEISQALRLKNTINKNSIILTNKFNANDFLGALLTISRRAIIDDVLKDIQ